MIPELWGVINLTSDSFYAASRANADDAVGKAGRMFTDGAAIVDIGAESTRPGAKSVAAHEQLEALESFIETYKATFGAPALKKISVDTRDLNVMAAVAERGVGFINDVSGGSREVYELVAKTGVGYVLVHAQGTPQTMQASPEYTDVAAEVEAYLHEHTLQLESAGVRKENIIWDTGIGFGKTVEHNLKLIAAHPRFAAHGYRVMAGVSRKSFIGKILGEARPEERLAGTLAAQIYLTLHIGGCDILRVHDVKEMADSLKIISAIAEHANG